MSIFSEMFISRENHNGDINDYDEEQYESQKPGNMYYEEDDSQNEEILKESEELNSEIVEVQEDQDEVDESTEDLDEANEAALATEKFIHNLLAAKYTGGLKAVHAELAVEHMNYMCRSLGIPQRMRPSIDYGFESYRTVGGISSSTEGVIDGIKDMFVTVIDGIIKGINWIIDKVRELATKVFGNVNKLESYALKVRAKVLKIDDSKSLNNDDKKYESISNATTLNVEGKVKTVSECVDIISKFLYAITNTTDSDIKSFGNVIDNAIKDSEKDISNALDNAHKKSDEDFREFSKLNDEVISDYSDHKKKAGIFYQDSTKKIFKRIQEITVQANSIKEIYQNNNAFKDISPTIAGQRYGLNLDSDYRVQVSDTLPRNKAYILYGPNPSTLDKIYKGEKILKFGVKQVNYKKEDSKDKEIIVESKSNLLKSVNNILKMIPAIKNLKRIVDSFDGVAKKIKKSIFALRTKYFSISSKEREDRSFIENIKTVRSTINCANACIQLLREPQMSFSTYCLFELKAILSIIDRQSSIYDEKEEKEEKEEQKALPKYIETASTSQDGPIN